MGGGKEGGINSVRDGGENIGPDLSKGDARERPCGQNSGNARSWVPSNILNLDLPCLHFMLGQN